MKTKVLYLRTSEQPREPLQVAETTLAVRVASHQEEALALIETEGPFGVVMADTTAEGNEGICFLTHAQAAMPQSIRICLASQPDWQFALRAVNEAHVYFLMSQPCPEDTLRKTIEAAAAVYQADREFRSHAENVQTGSLALLQNILRQMDPASSEFGMKSREYALALAGPLGFEDTTALETAALLARVGRISLPMALQQKVHAGIDLSFAEKDLLARTPEFGCKLMMHIPGLESAAKIILYTGKNFDGRGFPYDSVSGEAIPMGARILRLICDFVRLETEGQTRSQIHDQLVATAGIYDPHFLRTALRVLLELAPAGSKAASLADLRAGDILAASIETETGLIFLPAGQEITGQVLSKLHSFAQASAIKQPIYIKA
jgi:response regulator RpfG family c-di-GMP phosphodiesterase